jgi:CheY-like chemotaxis protein
MGNESLVTQVLVNLLSNAAAAIEQSDKRRGTIWVRTRRVGDHVTIEISDDGCGINPAELPRLRQPLVTGWKNNPSTGLGLATCDRVLATMKGTLDAVPRRGGGSTFLVNLPILRGKALRKKLPASPQKAPNIEGRPRVLMVDDERPILRAFTRLLSSSCDITTAESIDQLEEVLERGERFDLVLCDLMMPKRSIVDAYDDLRFRFPWLARRLVICTGGGFSDEARQFVGERGLRLLDKPFSPEAFNKVLSEMPGRRTDSWLT